MQTALDFGELVSSVSIQVAEPGGMMVQHLGHLTRQYQRLRGSWSPRSIRRPEPQQPRRQGKHDGSRDRHRPAYQGLLSDAVDRHGIVTVVKMY